MTFGRAIDLLKLGFKVCRRSWNKKRWVVLVGQFDYSLNIDKFESGLPFLGIKTKSDDFGVYSPSHCDILAIDWEVY